MAFIVKILKPIIVVLFLSMTLITLLATIARMFPVLPSFYWAGEVTRYLNFWITCLGIGIALQMGAHFSLTMLTDVLPPTLRRASSVVSHVGVLILFGVMIYYGIQMIAWNFDQLSAATEIPMSYVYVAIPICGALVVLQTLVSLFRVFSPKLETGDRQ